jgi:cell division protein FtsA
MLAAGIVLTGGTSKMEGVVELAEEIFHAPVRIGIPQNVKGLSDIVRNPIYSTGVGLLLYGVKQQQDRDTQAPSKDIQISFSERFSAWVKKHL